ncbi:hypothetical protein KSE_14370 [Kitasatospora setae KM-6054]|uniref:Lipoprotein n=1 Tax=Kitasatospora setae (strain ATCC 33774 / DSM 43861 / JCM 3304 / KCC A-0304 / NBRC 14216 / KM-6054) TaxID=452652 RepID=E4N7T4_KITSK|nr:hypothetical protein KSE_14370 [Kitasatospora setae KM-6054]
MATAVAGAALVAALAAGCGSTGGSAAANQVAPAATGGAVAGSPLAASRGGGNGVERLTADEALERSVAALKAAGTVRVAGAVTGQGGRIEMDLRIDTAGNCAGTLSQSGTGGFQVVKAGPDLWVKPDAAFWAGHGGSAMSDLVGDRYLKTTADDPDFGDIAELCDLNTIADQLGGARSELTKGEPTTVQGRPALPLAGDAGSGTGTLYVAATGDPVPLKLEKSTGSVEFSEFGTPVPSATPGPDQSLDLDRLGSPEPSASVV